MARLKNYFRTDKSYQKLHEYYASKPEGCFLCQRKGKDFKHWKLVKNQFPYDKVASKHYLLTIKRHVGKEKDFSQKEKDELIAIKNGYLAKTDFMFVMENLPKRQSAKDHYHLHVIKWK